MGQGAALHVKFMADNDAFPQPLGITIADEFVPIGLQGRDESSNPQDLKTEEDGTLRYWGLLVGRDPNNNERVVRLNADGELIVEIRSAGGKILGTSDPAASINTNLYTVPVDTSADIKTLLVCNRSSTSKHAIRIGVDVGGAGANAPDDSEWIVFDLDVRPKKSFQVQLGPNGLQLDAGDDLVVFTTGSDMSFIVSGAEKA